MGSWNDIGFVDGAVQSEYRELSGSFYAATCKRSRPAQTRVSARLTIGETAVQPAVR